MKKELPKYYTIKRDENNPLWDKYIDWLNKAYSNNFNGLSNGYYGFDGDGIICYIHINEFDNKPEIITLEFWDECVNGEQRKIIGYKAPFDMYEGKVKEGDLFSIASNPNYYTSNNAADKWLPKEIVEKWEVAYEEEKLDIKEWSSYTIIFEGKPLTQRHIDKIKEVIK